MKLRKKGIMRALYGVHVNQNRLILHVDDLSAEARKLFMLNEKISFEEF